ncbi:hypothetical protein DSECCO2_375810 [anaerobic digester metagenome]
MSCLMQVNKGDFGKVFNSSRTSNYKIYRIPGKLFNYVRTLAPDVRLDLFITFLRDRAGFIRKEHICQTN